MSTTIYRLWRAALPHASKLSGEVTAARLGPDATLPYVAETNISGCCRTFGGTRSTSEAEQKLQSSFHWFELYLGILVMLLLLAAIAKLACTYRKRKQSRDRWRTKDNLEAGVDGRYLARLLGDVAYAKNPDYDRMGWVNDVIVHMWPHVAAAAGHMIRKLADPLLQQNKPKWMSNVSLHTFTLGDIPPRVFGIKVYGHQSLVEQLLLDLDFSWTGNQKFQLKINPLPNLPVPLGIGHMVARFLGMRAGVSDLYIRGRLRISLKPLMSQMPVVGAIKVSFLEEAKLSYGMIIQGGDITFLPGLENFINGVLRNCILEQYTLPGGYTLPVAPGGGHEMPAGLLYAKLVEAQNVPNMDWLSKTDAYVKIYISGRRNRFTRVVWNSLNPRWNEEFELLVHDPEHETITCVLMNRSNVGADEEIGRVEVSLRELPSADTRDLWLAVGPPKDRQESNPLLEGIRALRKGGRIMKDTVATAATLSCIERLTGQRPPCMLHLQLSFYRVGAAEVEAAQQAGHLPPKASSNPRTGNGRSIVGDNSKRVINMLRGGILYVKIRKGLDMKENKDDLPSSARQVKRLSDLKHFPHM
ncbi:g8845 [Coccomyxa viridis]|uniref:G8845 protein n=1 Tax=Coccomyxa viridis TaxID=1274662 RepID=A0ABP1G1H6_9CHLO